MNYEGVNSATKSIRNLFMVKFVLTAATPHYSILNLFFNIFGKNLQITIFFNLKS